MMVDITTNGHLQVFNEKPEELPENPNPECKPKKSKNSV
jgi:hypothetical protein